MVEINTTLAPLELYEEDMNTPLELAAKQRQMVKQRLQESPAPFVIGSINLVNKRIQQLSGILQAHPPALQIETRFGVQPDKLGAQTLLKLPQIYLERRPKEKHLDAVPRLVELQHYPGFDKEPTPLPNNIALKQVWENVLQARSLRLKRTGYLTIFQELLSSTLLRDLLLDTFWWLFLHLYQSNYPVQCQLFNRISKNYVELIMKSQSYYYGDRFLQMLMIVLPEELPSILSQAVYTSFCCCFPQSWSQFHSNDFRSEVCNIVYQWIGGVRPTPRIYNKWNYDVLMPQEVKDMKSMTTTDTEQAKKKGTELNLTEFYWLPKDSYETGTGKSSSTSGSSVVKTNSRAQRKSSEVEHWSDEEENVEPAGHQVNKSSCSPGNRQSGSKVTMNAIRLARLSLHKQSQVAGRGPEFVKNLFNLFGLSPLVLNFLHCLNVEPRAGENIYVTRTEIHRLPQDDAPTYGDVLEAGYKNVLKLKEMKQKLIQPLAKSRKCGQENKSIPRQQPAAKKGSKKRQSQSQSQNAEAAATTHRDNGVDRHQLGEDTELTEGDQALGKEREI